MSFFISLLAFFLPFGAQIQIANELLTVEIAKTPKERSRGLTGRTHLAEGEGMLFVYEQEQRLVFWMKDTLIPLSVAFFDEERFLINILDMDPPIGATLIRYRSTAPALYALEVPQGWFENHGIGRGAKFSFIDKEGHE